LFSPNPAKAFGDRRPATKIVSNLAMKIPKKMQAIAITVVIVYDTRNKFSTLCWQVLPLYGDLQKQMLSLQTPRPSRHGGLHSSVGVSGSGGQFVGIAWFKLLLVLAA